VRFARSLRHIVVAVAAVALVAVTVGGASAQPLKKRMLRVTATGQGVVASADGRIRCGARCSAAYQRGAVVRLAASPQRFFSFERWTGGCVGTSPTCIVALDRATAVRAVFVRNLASVSLIVGGPGAIVSDPAGLACGKGADLCQAEFVAGTTIRLTPVPASEGAFGVWGGACRGASGGACDLFVGSGGEVLAAFRSTDPDPDEPRLTVTLLEGEGPITSEPPGINCPPTCQAEFTTGTVVTLRAPRTHDWGVACAGRGDSCMLVVDESDGVTARSFAQPPTPFGINVSVSGRGVVSGGGKIRCGGTTGRMLDCGDLFDSGSIVVLKATAARRSRFAGWGGFCRGKKRHCSVRVTAPKTVQALFRRR
jgi:hypothetical protein